MSDIFCFTFLGQRSAEGDWTFKGVRRCSRLAMYPLDQSEQANLLSFESTIVQHGRSDATSLYNTGELQKRWATVQIGSSISRAMIR